MNNIPTITRRFVFDAAHRLLNHTGKCRHLHGHRYEAELTFKATKLDHMGMVTDFSLVKKLVEAWLNQHWDHNTILHPEDDQLWLFLRNDPHNGDKKPYLLQLTVKTELMTTGEYNRIAVEDLNPTVENMTKVLFQQIKNQLLAEGYNFELVSVQMFETENCSAFYQEN